MQMTAAEALVRCLQELGVDLVFGYPGGNILPVYDALYDADIKHVLVRHEQGAVHAADGYARVTGRVGVCLATSGPGATNLVTGIANAYMDSVPLVVFTGQVPTTMVGTDAFQEVDITGITIPVTKHNYLVKEAKRLPAIIRQAFHIASTGRPGPVLIDLPKNVLNEKITWRPPERVKLRGYRPTYKGHPSQIKQAAKMINEAKQPVIYAGGGVIASGAAAGLLELAETINAPVVSTLMGLGGFPGGHPLALGMLGLHGSRYANQAVTECDLLIALGVRFDDRVTSEFSTFAPKAKIIHMDIDPAEIGKNVRVNLPIVGDVKNILTALIPLLDKKENRAWLDQVNAWRKQFPLRYEPGAALRPQFVIETLAEIAGDNAVIVTDVGQHQMWTAQYYSFKEPRTLVTSGGLGTMGFGLPAAVGAKLGAPDKDVYLVTGDGSLQMCMQEFATAIEQGLALKIIILNNHRLGMVRQLQEYYCGKRYIGVDFVKNPDFVKFAQAYDATGIRVTDPKELRVALEQAKAAAEPVIADCIIAPEENVFPMVKAGRPINEVFDGTEEEVQK